MSSQLWQTILAGSSVSADRQDAAPDEEGSYGGLMDAIDQVVQDTEAEDRAAPKPTGKRKPRSSSAQ